MNIPEIVELLRVAHARGVASELPTSGELDRMARAIAKADATLRRAATPTPWVMDIIRILPASLRRLASGTTTIRTRCDDPQPAHVVRSWLESSGWYEVTAQETYGETVTTRWHHPGTNRSIVAEVCDGGQVEFGPG